ncbi:MAG: hypothetical protein EXR77_03645 [Myxococcales bacterium]|nr:hypothetical protein [Myxococcales bacterium]
MNLLSTRAAIVFAALSLSTASCTKEQPKAAAAGEAKPEAKPEAPAEGKAGDNAAKPAAEAAAANPAAAAAATAMTPEKIAEMTAKAAAASLDDKLVATNMAISALNAGELDEKKENFKPGQAAVDAASAAIRMVGSVTTNPTLSAEDKEKFKKTILSQLAQAARTGNSAVRSALAQGACTSLASDPEVLKGIDDALSSSTNSPGWRNMFICVMNMGPMEYQRVVEKKLDYDRWSTVDRQVAVFKANADPAIRDFILSGLGGFKGKSDALVAALVESFDILDGAGKSWVPTILGNMCAKDAGKPLLDKLATAAPGTVEAGVKTGLETAFKACK